MEAIVKASAADWTIVRPAQLTDGPRTGDYRLASHYSLPHGNQISRADVADFLVKQIESSVYSRQGVAIAY
jgi:putative NADH-flavin reductase